MLEVEDHPPVFVQAGPEHESPGAQLVGVCHFCFDRGFCSQEGYFVEANGARACGVPGEAEDRGDEERCSGCQWHRKCYSYKMTQEHFPVYHAAGGMERALPGKAVGQEDE